MDKKTKKVSYEAPEVKVIEVKLEKGFAASGYSSVNGWGDGGSYEGTLYE